MALLRFLTRSHSFSNDLFLILLFILSVEAHDFNRDQCLRDTRWALGNQTISPNDPIFFIGDDGRPMSNLENPVLTLAGCRKLCGSHQGWYSDTGPRLNAWLIPIFLLVSNMEVSPLDKRRYFMSITHLLGDPIDTVWSLLLKVEVWRRCALRSIRPRRSTRRVRNRATVLAAIEEILDPDVDPVALFNTLVADTRLSHEALDRLIGRTAWELADSRTDELVRTVFAAFLYLYQVLSAFIATLGGGNTSPPGGRIGTAMFMSWLVPVILLSNAIGGFASRRTCFSILDRFAHDVVLDRPAHDVALDRPPRNVAPSGDLLSSLKSHSPQSDRYDSIKLFFDAQSWAGGIYSYRLRKDTIFTSGLNDRSMFSLLLLAASPLIVSTIIASLILWDTPPVGINCRNVLIFSLASTWFLSFLVTWSCSHSFIRSRVQESTIWRCILAKNAVIAIVSVLLIFLSSCGIFNSCWCWSAPYSLGSSRHVALNPVPFLDYNYKTVYPALVGVCLGLQILIFSVMIWSGWDGLKLMRWSEEARRSEWEHSRS